MPLLTAGPSRFLGGGAALGWWRAGGTIPAANVLEYVENPAARQLYAGASATGAWTVAFRTNLASLPAPTAYALDAQTGRMGIGVDPTGNGVYTSAWNDRTLFATGDHSYMVISDGANIQCYLDASAVGAAISSANNIGGNVRWRSRNVDLATNWYEWPVAIPRGMVANIALDATQRAALHTSLMA